MKVHETSSERTEMSSSTSSEWIPIPRPPVGVLLGRPAEESRKTCERRGNAATIHERDNQIVVSALNIDSIRDGFTGQSAHPTQ